METKPLHIERTYMVPVEKMWQMWTESEEIKKWWGPTLFSCPVAEIDPREGGKYLFCMRGAMGPGMPEQDFWSAGTFKEVIPLQKLVMLDHFADKDGNYVNASVIGMPGEWPDELMITVEFTPVEGGTKVAVTNEGHPTDMEAPAQEGWGQQLDKLADAVK